HRYRDYLEWLQHACRRCSSGVIGMTKKTSSVLIIGLTGGIGMGKSTAAKILRRMGFPIYHADRAVHDLLRKGGKAVKPVAGLFPKALKRGAIDRAVVGRIVFGQPAKLKKLE